MDFIDVQIKAALTDRAYVNTFWNLDGVAFGYRIGPNGEHDELRLDELLQRITCINDFSKGETIYAWTAHSTTEINSLRTKPLDDSFTPVPSI